MSTYLTFKEAAKYLSLAKDGKITENMVLKAGCGGILTIVAMFPALDGVHIATNKRQRIPKGYKYILPGFVREIEDKKQADITMIIPIEDDSSVYRVNHLLRLEGLRVDESNLSANLHLVLVDAEAVEHRRKVNRANAQRPRESRKDLHEELLKEFYNLVKGGHTSREARGILLQRGRCSQSTIYRVTKK